MYFIWSSLKSFSIISIWYKKNIIRNLPKLSQVIITGAKKEPRISEPMYNGLPTKLLFPKNKEFPLPSCRLFYERWIQRILLYNAKFKTGLLRGTISSRETSTFLLWRTKDVTRVTKEREKKVKNIWKRKHL